MANPPEQPDAVPVLGHAPMPPRAMSTGTRIALAAGVAGVAVGLAIAVGGYVYRARQVQYMPLPGEVASPDIQWHGQDVPEPPPADPTNPSPTEDLETAPLVNSGAEAGGV